MKESFVRLPLLSSLTTFSPPCGQGMDDFACAVNLEVQWASERVIAAVERAGGTITTAFYDVASLQAMVDPERFFKRGEPAAEANSRQVRR